MVANVACSSTSCIQTAPDIFISAKGLYTSYLLLQFENVLPCSKRDVAQNEI